jgi:hypothetical protein
LATFKGQLIADAQAPSGGIRLALVWYAHTGSEGLGAPGGIVTQDVVYQGTFPVNYVFDVIDPPPPQTLVDLSEEGGPKKGALGVLLAYEDLNGNGKLDVIPAAGAPIDRVLGASLDLHGPSGHVVVYVAEKSAGGDALAQSLELGFNLIQMDLGADLDGLGIRVPLTTPVPITLTGQGLLNIFVCEELFRSDMVGDQAPCGVEFEIPSEQGVRVGGTLMLDDNGALISLHAVKDGQPVPGTTAALDGVPLPSDGVGGFQVYDDTGAALSAGATHVVTIVIPGEPTIVESVLIPGAFHFTAPTSGAVLPVGEKLSAQWTAASGADEYLVWLSGADRGVLFQNQATTTFTTEQPISSPGTVNLSVTARGNALGRISGMYGRALQMTFE